MKKWITFDLDGTLMQNPFDAWIFPEVETLLSEELKYSCDAKKRLFHAHQQMLRNEQIVAAYDWDDLVRQLIQELGLTREIDIEALVVTHSVEPKVYLLDDTVIPALRRLKEEGYDLAAVTNGYYKYQYPVMKALGLTEWLDVIVTPERTGYAKPNIRMLDSLLSEGELVAHVGDRLDHDVTIANQLGVVSVLIHRDLPEELLGLSPKQRADHIGLGPVLEGLAARENPQLAGMRLPQSYQPNYVIRDLEELFHCLDIKKR
ncbi:haloacid dehalogenase superfamily, subfamily IA, variant 1 with third motif having Dx(3-4)D or Dx(3-4)E [Paenibacillus uliginis N3/975]|uniref:Haloacid dehalogenase superfamily, subfamily IA, variant 1 with third motif having Dx(3-4)D or Dx(3-4)E n=1 Tax=Paenibacillus uliginis N3/975 TaxID=1313296 RepID=A0A1X7HMA1_9BACL|nr:HAD family hydrolase [Paenibacillus uliginis]SMF88876.1 haloacid dehalogenase superfamily, subfamily IA, variant 1 with third motif having Dx(3-4)D or Dx(3-4)E [Paenibacillus uliginis N3/975]